MPLPIYTSAAFTNGAGVQVASNASVEVRRESDGSLVPIFEDRDGQNQITQPGFQADLEGRFDFYAEPEAEGWEITVTAGADTHTLNGQFPQGGVFGIPAGERALRTDELPFGLREIVVFTSSGTFQKGDYSWLRAARIKVQGGGSGSFPAPATASGEMSVGGAGGGGCYAESFLLETEIPASVTVTVGDGGAAESSGGDSSFGELVEAEGGRDNGQSVGPSDGPRVAVGSEGGSVGVGDIVIPGGGGGYSTALSAFGLRRGAGLGGASFLATNTYAETGGNALPGNQYGAGASGNASRDSSPTKDGEPGAQGVVIVELYA